MIVLILISVLLVSSILYMINCVKNAKVYIEEVDKASYSKPTGWKIGKLPEALKKQNKTVLRENGSCNSASVMENLIASWKTKELSKENKADFSK